MRTPSYGDAGQPGFVGVTDAPLVRTRDRRYAHESAAEIAPRRGRIQAAVIDAYRAHGPMSSKTAEALPEFAHYGRSTVQKRISELLGAGVLEYVEGADEATYILNEERVLDPLPPADLERCPTCNQLLPSGPGSRV